VPLGSEEITMSQTTSQIKATRPAQMARAMLGEALGQIQDVRDARLNADGVTASIAKAVGALFAVQSSEPDDPAHCAGVCQAMDYLRGTLEQMQEITGEEPALTNATRTIAKTLAILYPVSKIQQRQSMLPGAPAAASRGELPRDPRRQVPRFSIETEIGFQSDSNFFTGFTEDVSEGGLFVATYDNRPIGAKLCINFTLPNGYLVSAEGIVRWTREYNGATPNVHPGMGVQFTVLAKDDRAEINRFIRKREPMFYEA
jgi:uncharacterized protein (TIGR02266 family)